MPFDLGPWLPDFPIREHSLYLDHAAVCPLPRPVAQAMRDRIAGQEQRGYEDWETWSQATLTCRHLGAQLIGCEPDDVTLVRSTSEGLSLIAEGLEWSPGDEVLLGEEEFAANAAPWVNLKRHGVRVVRLPQPDGRLDPQQVAARLTDRTRVLAVSWVAFHTGWITPLASMARICHDNQTMIVVDAIQGLGAIPMHMSALGLDAVVADSHKWMLGPEGIGLMATSKDLREALHPVISGWRNVVLARGDFFLQGVEYRADGRRFEPGATNEIGIAGLAAALDLLHSVGQDVIQSRIEVLSRLVTRVLLAHGWEVLSPGAGHPIAGIVAGRPSSVPPREAVRRLRERRIICSARQGYVRFSPHFYVTKGEIEALDRILEKAGL